MTNLDLNLLRTFDALMEHRSVTNAASSLCVTQSAVSDALSRLRSALNDPLFERTPRGLHPTPRAEAMAAAVRRGLLHFHEAVDGVGFDPATAERDFTLAASSYFCSLLVPAVVDRLRREAPNVSLRLVPWSEMLTPLFDRGAVDLALGASLDMPSRFVVEPLYKEQMVWIAAPANPIVTLRMGLDQIAEPSRILIVPSRPFDLPGRLGDDVAAAASATDWESASLRRNRVVAYDSQSAVAIVARTDLIARVPERVAALAAATGRVEILSWIIEDFTYEMVMIWPGRLSTDRGLSWLRSIVSAEAARGPTA